jgi:hypothetical protein
LSEIEKLLLTSRREIVELIEAVFNLVTPRWQSQQQWGQFDMSSSIHV